MSSALFTLAHLATHEQAFGAVAQRLGFSSAGDIERFLFKAYGKALRKIPTANRPRGAIFFLEAPAVSGALPAEADLLTAIEAIHHDVGSKVYSLRLDLAAGGTVPHDLSAEEKRMMSGNMWPRSAAQMVSRQEKRCAVWANGVEAVVYLDGDTYRETVSVVDELPSGVSRAADRLPWDDGAIVFEFGSHELNDTSRAGVWCVPGKHILYPKPETMMSRALGKFLRMRLACYLQHADEPYIENSGRADIVLTLVDGRVFLIEVKWTGMSLTSTQASAATDEIVAALKAKTKGWFTTYDDSTFDEGVKQMKIYFANGGYDKAFLVVFDCCAPAAGRTDGDYAINPAHIAPHSLSSFRALRACVEPRKASTVSKATSP
ncbi:MAG: hypothetical protein KF715_15950 [Candidatus Didemnitutus sp.]|nr:hypothetical protein [Candidatus Didemnitutus sp.]